MALENLEMAAVAARWFWTSGDPVLNRPAGLLAATADAGRGADRFAPDLLMLDEPSMGLAPTIVDTVFDRIEYIRRAHG